MLTDKDIEKVSDVVAKRMEIVTQRYLEMVAKSVKKIGSLSATDAHRIKHMASLGADLKKIKAYLGKELGMDEKAVESLFATFAKDAYDAQAVYYNATGTFQKTFAENKELQDILRAQYRNTQGDFKNIANSTGVALHDKDGKVVYKSLDEAYNDIIDESITAVTSGVSDFNSEMRRSLTDLANSGVRTIDYASGYSRSIESAVRANIFEGIQRCMQETREQAGREFGANGVEISVHMKCAPDHLPYQGKQYSDEKFKYLQGTLTRPIGHLNCRHHIFPIVLGVSNPAYSPAQLRQIQQENTAKSVTIDGKQYTPYEATQIQRKLENSIRKQKDVYNTLLEAGDKEGANGAKNRLRQLFNKYTDVSNQAGLKKQSFRTFMPTKKQIDASVEQIEKIANDTGVTKFIPAKTIEEAEKFANDNFVDGGFNLTGNSISYKNIDIDVANKVNERLYDIYSQYDIPNLTSLESYGKANKKIFAKDGDAPMFTTNMGNMGLNSTILKNMDTVNKYIQDGEQAYKYVIDNMDKLSGKELELAKAYKLAGRNLVDESLEGMVTHEMGHHISYIPSVNKELAKIQNTNWQDYAKHLSGYSNKSYGEYISESFVAYYKGEKDKVQPELVKVFDSLKKPVGQPQIKKVTNMQEAFVSLQETFTDVDKKILKFDEALLVDNVNKFNELNDRFGAVTKVNNSIEAVNKRYIASVSSAYYNPKDNINFNLTSKYYKDADLLKDVEFRGREQFFSMPFSDENWSVNTITHEYGHAIEAKVVSKRLRKQYTEMGFNYDTDSVEILKDFSGLKRSYKRHENDIRNEILDIAKSNNPNFDLLKNLSEYGRTNSAEFFAEVFANSQCGQPNELGKAMELWLAKEGY